MLTIVSEESPQTPHHDEWGGTDRVQDQTTVASARLLTKEGLGAHRFQELHVKRTQDWRVIADISWTLLYESPDRGIIEYYSAVGEHHAWHQLFCREAAIRALHTIGEDPGTIDLLWAIQTIHPAVNHSLDEWLDLRKIPEKLGLGLYGFYDRLAEKAFYTRPEGGYWTSVNGGILNHGIMVTDSHYHPNFFSRYIGDAYLSVVYPVSPKILSH